MTMALCWVARGIIALNWLAIASALVISGVTKPQALFAFAVFRLSAVLGLGYLLYELGLVARKRATTVALIADGFLVLSMFFFWFIVRAATF